jgi:4-diphosphocytidyl-2-C-methyl-D-erythritol kinase
MKSGPRPREAALIERTSTSRAGARTGTEQRTTVRVHAAAKVNPALFVGPRRADGYHPLVSVMQSVALWDHLEVTLAAPGLGFELEVEGGGLPADEGNLVLVAARELARRIPDGPGAHFRLRKGIPVAAGMGGGSTDGAAALVALDRLWDLHLPTANLERMAVEVGSDVPFCVGGGTRLATGRGEVLTDVKVNGTLWWVVGIDEGGLSTAAVYRRFDELGLDRPVTEDDAAPMLEALAAGDPALIGPRLTNMLEPAAFDVRPDLCEARRHMLDAGALGAVMSGSGPTMLGLARDSDHAEQVARAVAGRFARVEVARAPVPGVTFG